MSVRYRIGVVIVAYNHAKFVRDCIAALEQQEDTELVIRFGDNASADGTLAIAKEAFAASGRLADVAYFEGDGDGWSDIVRRAILSLPPGLDACTILSADDRHKPNALPRLTALLKQRFDHPVLAVTGMLLVVTEQLEPVRWFKSTRPSGTGAHMSGDPVEILLQTGSTIPMLGVFDPRVLEVAVSYLDGLKYVDDTAVFAALCELGGTILHAPIHFTDYRQHGSSANRTRQAEVYADVLRVFDRLEQRTGLSIERARDQYRRWLLREVGISVAQRERWEKVRYAASAAVEDWAVKRPDAARAARDVGAFAEGLARGAVRLIRKAGGGGPSA